jgi:hypothetical protein
MGGGLVPFRLKSFLFRIMLGHDPGDPPCQFDFEFCQA